MAWTAGMTPARKKQKTFLTRITRIKTNNDGLAKSQFLAQSRKERKDNQ